jgi:hypothetical protein
MPGNENSGRKTGSEERKLARQLAQQRKTAETKEFQDRAAIQRGDKLFKVKRVYANGHKATLGTIDSPRDERVGATFGGGVYELHELDRATEYETGKILKINLHPDSYPAKKNYAKDPYELEREGAGSSTAGASLMNLNGLTPEQIHAKAYAQAKDDMRREELSRTLERQLADLNNKIARIESGEIGAGKKSSVEEFILIAEAIKKLSPPPAPNFNGPQDPMAQMQASVELFKNMKGMFGQLSGEMGAGNISPMGERLISSLSQLADRGFRVYEKTLYLKKSGGGAGGVIEQPAGWANTAQPMQPPAILPNGMAARAAARREPAPAVDESDAGWANTARRPAPPQVGAKSAAAAVAKPGSWPQATPGYEPKREDFPSQPAFDQFQEDAMTFELVEFLKKEMTGIMARTPGFSVEGTAREISRRLNAPNLPTPWKRLREAVRGFTTDTLVDHLVELQPELCPTQGHRDVLAALVDVLKQIEGANV